MNEIARRLKSPVVILQKCFRKRHFLSLMGFTLVEVLLALVILGVGVTALLSLFAVGTNSVRRAVNLAEACLVAQMVMEYYCYTGYYGTMATSGIPARPQETYNANYSAYWPSSTDMSLTNIATVNNLYRIDLGIYRSGNKIADFSTFITQY